MKLLDRYEFTNGRRYETYHLELEDARRLNVPECDVLGLLTISGEDGDESRMSVMRPDEALIQARMLIDAVNRVTSGYEIELKQDNSKTTPNVETHPL